MADSLSFLQDQKLLSESEEELVDLDGFESELSRRSVCHLDVSNFGSDPALYVLEAFSEKYELKEGTLPDIRHISSSVLKSFVPKSSQDIIQKAVDLASWRSLGYKSSCEQEDKESNTPNPSVLFKSVKELLMENVEYVDLACPLFNQMLGGGLRCGTVTEISGESSSGKSQICLHTTAVNSLKGNPVIYLQTEGSFPLSRLEQILQARIDDQNEVVRSMDVVLIKKIHNFGHLQSVLENDIGAIIKDRGVKLVIIDSVTAVLRGEKDIENISERTDIVQRIGIKLQQLVMDLNFAALVVNQVSAAINFPGHTFGRDVVPSLGSLWSNYINTRLFLTKTDFIVGKGMVAGMLSDCSLRTLEIDFSSYLAEDFFNFVVTPSGITGIRITD